MSVLAQTSHFRRVTLPKAKFRMYDLAPPSGNPCRDGPPDCALSAQGAAKKAAHITENICESGEICIAAGVRFVAGLAKKSVVGGI